MNKGILTLLLGVILVAMVLIMVTNRSPIETGVGIQTADLPDSVRQPVSPDTGSESTAAAQTGAQSKAASTSPARVADPVPAPTPADPVVPVEVASTSSTASTAGTKEDRQGETAGSGASETAKDPVPAEKSQTASKTAQTTKSKGTGFFDIPDDTPQASKKADKPRQKTENLDKTVTVAGRTAEGTVAKPPVKTEVKEEPKGKADTLPSGPVDGPRGVSLHFSQNGMIVRIRSDKAFSAKAFTLTGPDRLVVDLTGDFAWLKTPEIPSNTLIKGARIGQQPKATRLVFDLTRTPKKYDRKEFSSTNMEVHVE